MRPSIRGFFAIPGSALIAFSLCGSTWHPAVQNNPASSAEIALYNQGRRLYALGQYTAAGQVFRAAALRAQSDGSPRQSALNWNNSGGAALARMDFRDALPDFLKARQTAEASGSHVPFLISMNNLAQLYLEMRDPESAILVAKQALYGRSEWTDESADGGKAETDGYAKLRYQLATGLALLHRFDEAEPLYFQAIGELAMRDDFDASARILGNFGSQCLEAGRLDEAGDALSRALFLVRLHHLNASANILRALAKLKSRQGDLRSAAALFDAAIEAPQSITPKWEIYTDRGEFRLAMNNLRGALADFREARRLAMLMRADIVPADRDRIAFENGLSRVPAGLVDAGNRLAQQTSDLHLLRETFDEAEEGRLWSLRALVPAPDDWRARLPSAYWEVLARYQSLESTLPAAPTAELTREASALRSDLQQIEAAANEAGPASTAPARDGSVSAFAHVRRVLNADSVLLSFQVTKSSGWLWAVDKHGVSVYTIPRYEVLQSAVRDFARAAQNGEPQAVDLGRGLYELLFGNVAPRYLAHQRWLLELDGPLFNLPFPALVTGIVKRKNEPIYLSEHTVLETIPDALLLEPRAPFVKGAFLGVGDPIYNAADPRYRGAREQHGNFLPRLPETAPELEACARAWNPAGARLLTGEQATLPGVRQALRTNPAVIHFATHVVTGPGDYASGLIALSLDRAGAMELLGPAEIAAHPITSSLVVLNGCHSSQGEALPSAGRMGLTRAWIGAGALFVLATQWDIPDEQGAAMTVEFYKALKRHPERGPAFALQQSQSIFRKAHSLVPVGGQQASIAVWGAYFVLGRQS